MSRLVTHFGVGAFLAYSLKDSTYELFRTKAVIPYVTRTKEEDYFGGAWALTKGIWGSLYEIRAKNVGLQQAEKDAFDAAKHAIKATQQAVSAASSAVETLAKDTTTSQQTKKEDAPITTQPSKPN